MLIKSFFLLSYMTNVKKIANQWVHFPSTTLFQWHSGSFYVWLSLSAIINKEEWRRQGSWLRVNAHATTNAITWMTWVVKDLLRGMFICAVTDHQIFSYKRIRLLKDNSNDEAPVHKTLSVHCLCPDNQLAYMALTAHITQEHKRTWKLILLWRFKSAC